ncbi:uncharacterized protein LOC117649566 [Thrips palmi]|uniref:Uncharacterized protein LOC117649566 n=1 Tax=Thrips palmi TaxID=161013 RepID=A0A6P8ZSV3_THRPL|nr:uncharacterized protein LOC117649566 [Thrips palmi]
MGAASSHECFPAVSSEEPPWPSPPPPPPNKLTTQIQHGTPPNALGLTWQEVADVRRTHGLLARDATSHCVRMHIKYFRRFPTHLERFCGRAARAEPLHYAPAELKRDSEFTSRALMHGLAQLQSLRCSCTGDDAMASQLAALARAHRGLGLTRDSCRQYRDALLDYLEEALPQAMTPSVRQSWRTFLTTLCDGLADCLADGLDHPDEHQARRNALTSSWVEHELPKGWPLVVYYTTGGHRTSHGTHGRRRPSSSTCTKCGQAACTCKWDTIHEESAWRQDSDPSMLENAEQESCAALEGKQSQCASESLSAGTSASQFAAEGTP